MKLFRDQPIETKQRIILIVTCGIALLLASVSFATGDILRLRQTMITQLFTLSELVAFNSDVGIVYGDAETTTKSLEILKTNPRIVAAHIFNQEGEQFASYYRDLQGKTPLSPYITLSEYYLARPSLDAAAQITLKDVQQTYFFRDGHVVVFKHVLYNGKKVGVVYIQSDMEAFYESLWQVAIIAACVLVVSLLLAFLLASNLQKLITKPLLSLASAMKTVCSTKDYSLRETKYSNDELGLLVDGFNTMLGVIEGRDHEINTLNERLKLENVRMGAELEVTRQLQQMVLPRIEELMAVESLDIAGFMEAADEVGGDYYDILKYGDGRVKIGIGDVTGHGLESGVVMLMVQTAVRTLLENGVTDPKQFLIVLNRTIYNNICRMGSDKNLTISIMDYVEQDGHMTVAGQHEEAIIIRANGVLERIDTIDLGFMVGMQKNIERFVNYMELGLNPGDAVILYTDGITEAMNAQKDLYGIDRLCQVAQKNRDKSAVDIQREILKDIKRHLGECKPMDDITLIVFKRR